MVEYVRTQVMLDKKQRIQLNELAEKMGISFSEIVRDFLNAQLRIKTYEDMRHAAAQLYNDYASDENLTDMTALDGEDFIHE